MDTHEAIFDRLKDHLLNGGAVCLLGAGFSTAATDQNGKKVPSSEDLVAEIKVEIGISESEYASLADIADYCEDNPEIQRKLRDILTRRLTLCKADEAQRTIINQPWRAIFTTNFDDIVERSVQGGVCQVITPVIDPEVHMAGKIPLYYLHGRAKDLIEKDVDPKLVISERNYLQLPVHNSALYARLINELFCARLIVIIGYSMRDLDVARLLIEGGNAFRQKTIIICRPDETGIAISRLRKFGEVLPVGVEGLANELKGHFLKPDEGKINFQFIDVLNIEAPSPSIMPCGSSGRGRLR